LIAHNSHTRTQKSPVRNLMRNLSVASIER